MKEKEIKTENTILSKKLHLRLDTKGIERTESKILNINKIILTKIILRIRILVLITLSYLKKTQIVLIVIISKLIQLMIE